MRNGLVCDYLGVDVGKTSGPGTLSVISGHIYVWVQTTKPPFGPSCVS